MGHSAGSAVPWRQLGWRGGEPEGHAGDVERDRLRICSLMKSSVEWFPRMAVRGCRPRCALDVGAAVRARNSPIGQAAQGGRV